MHNDYDADLIVIGGGVLGLCAAYYAACKGQNVILIEKYFCGTQEGSSAGHVRMWRTMYTELNHAVLAYKAGELYKKLEIETDKKFLHQHGLLNFGVETHYTPEGTLLSTLEVLKKLDKKFILLNKKQIESRYPFKNLPNDYQGIFQPDNAVIDVKHFMQALVVLNKIYGVKIIEQAEVEAIQTDANGAVVKMCGQSLCAQKAILALGPFSNSLLNKCFDFTLNMLIWEMCFAFYRVTPQVNYPMWFQFDETKNTYSNLFYGFPNVSFGRENFVMIAVDWASHIMTDPMHREYVPRLIDVKITQDYVRQHMVGVDNAPIDIGSALIAHLPDNHSVVDHLPNFVPHHKNIVICTGGWAFKFAPLFGKICAELAIDGETEENILPFSIHRKNILQLSTQRSAIFKS